MNKNSEIKNLLWKMLPWGAVMAVLCWGVMLFRGFIAADLLGILTGFVYVCLCYVYLARCCERAVSMDIKNAKKLMFRCYLLRYAGLFGLCAFAMLTKHINVVGVLVPQFFPAMILRLMYIFNRRGVMNE